MADYYADLGVSRDASDEDIRAAFRRKAKQYHPDRQGGNPDKMAEINRAYTTLSDPDRRLTYDSTGRDQHQDYIESTARDNVIQKFLSWLAQDYPQGDMIFAVQTALSQEIAKQQQAQNQGTLLLTRMEKRITRLKFKGKGTNFVAFALEHKLDELRQQIALSVQGLKILERAGEIAKEFEYEQEPLSQFFSRVS